MTVTQRDRGETPESQRPPAIRTKTSETERHSDQRDSPRDSNTEIRTVRRNWTSSSPSPPSPMMSRPEVLGLRSVAKRRGPKAGRVGWGRVGVGDLWGDRGTRGVDGTAWRTRVLDRAGRRSPPPGPHWSRTAKATPL